MQNRTAFVNYYYCYLASHSCYSDETTDRDKVVDADEAAAVETGGWKGRDVNNVVKVGRVTWSYGATRYAKYVRHTRPRQTVRVVPYYLQHCIIIDTCKYLF